MHQRIISSENLERCIIIIENADNASIAWSLSDTASKLFNVILEKPRVFATDSLFRGYVVAANAPDPRGIVSILS